MLFHFYFSIQFILEEIFTNFKEILLNNFGCFVIKKMIELAWKSDKIILLEKILPFCSQLLQFKAGQEIKSTYFVESGMRWSQNVPSTIYSIIPLKNDLFSNSKFSEALRMSLDKSNSLILQEPFESPKSGSIRTPKIGAIKKVRDTIEHFIPFLKFATVEHKKLIIRQICKYFELLTYGRNGRQDVQNVLRNVSESQQNLIFCELKNHVIDYVYNSPIPDSQKRKGRTSRWHIISIFFKTAKNKSNLQFIFDELKGYITSLCTDESRHVLITFLMQNCLPTQVGFIFEETLADFEKIIINRIGWFVTIKLFETVDEIGRKKFLDKIFDNFENIILDKFGSKFIGKLIQLLDGAERSKILEKIYSNFKIILLNEYGFNVIEKIMKIEDAAVRKEFLNKIVPYYDKIQHLQIIRKILKSCNIPDISDIDFKAMAESQASDPETQNFRSTATDTGFKLEDVSFEGGNYTLLCNLSQGHPKPLVPVDFR